MTEADQAAFARGAARGIAAVLRDPELRRDALQNAWVALLTRAPWAGDADLSTWAWRVGSNCARELLRREARHLRCETLPSDAAERFAGAAPSPEAQTMRQELTAQLHTACATLPPGALQAARRLLAGVPAGGSAERVRRMRAVRRLAACLAHRGTTSC